MPKYLAPHTVAVKAIKRFAGQKELSIKQTEILMAIYEIRYLSMEDLGMIADVRPGTLKDHLYELYKKRWLVTHPKELDMVSLTSDNRESLAKAMHFIHKDLREQFEVFRAIADVEEELAE